MPGRTGKKRFIALKREPKKSPGHRPGGGRCILTRIDTAIFTRHQDAFTGDDIGCGTQ